MEKTATVKAWTSSPEDAVRFCRGEIALDELLYANNDMSGYNWQYIGEAKIELTTQVSDAECIGAAISSLRSKKSKIYAEAEEAAQNVEARIQRLLAIEDKSSKAATIQIDENGNEVFVADVDDSF